MRVVWIGRPSMQLVIEGVQARTTGVVLTGLFDAEELEEWREGEVLARHGNETFYADNTRGRYAHPKLADYVKSKRNDKMIFVSDTLRGAFGRAWRSARKPPRRKLLIDFAERPIFSIGVSGGSVPRHGNHPETWHALLSGIKAWWLPKLASKASAALAASSFEGWDDPCGSIQKTIEGHQVPTGISLCVQNQGEVLYFGDNVEHATCSLSDFSLAVGAQGHTEAWPDLLRAANRGDLAAVKKALKHNFANPNAPSTREQLVSVFGRYGHAPLHRAALHGFPEVVEHLLAARAEPTQRDAEGLTPTFLAAFSGHVQVLRALAGHVSVPKEHDSEGATPLQWAATQGHLEVAGLLLEHQVDVSTTNDAGGGPMSAAATTGHVDMLKKLASHRGAIHEVDVRGMMPLHWAALHGHAEVVQTLLELRAEPHVPNLNEQKPVDLAQERSVLKLLQEGGPTRQSKRWKHSRSESEL
ncbi:unnamed protein product [Durusdinium trenchii]|uniref:Uncharacterized protein n=1 Tax=Durusdinium trenchii TaxID=1381693 RepID=A0ABP0QWV7_9DINO